MIYCIVIMYGGKSMIIVIPAYEPDEKLLGVLQDFTEQTEYSIIVVNDGSSEPCRPVFDAVKRYSRVTLLEHEVNRGKGAAMKTAFAYIASNYSADESVMTVDADGQHLVKDALRVAERLNEHPDALILGSRKFTGNVPFKSRMGNAITRGVFRFTTGVPVYDTQTGLRAFSARRISEMLALKGDRYEYEINQLVYCTQHQIDIVEEWIETVYIEENKSSHFHVLKDSFRIYKILLLGTSFIRFIASSFSCFLMDYAVYAVLLGVTPMLLQNDGVQSIWTALFAFLNRILPFRTWVVPPIDSQSVIVSVVGARVVSATLNYILNRHLVFHAKDTRMSFLKYVLLTVIMLVLQSLFTFLAVDKLGLNKWIIYIPVQIILYPLSYVLQRAIVFRKKES